MTDEVLPTEAEVFAYLDELRASGETNMYGAREYVEDEFGVSKHLARAFLTAWRESFAARHPASQ